MYIASDEDPDDSAPKVITLPGAKEKKPGSEFIELYIQESQVDSLISSRDPADEGKRNDKEPEKQRSSQRKGRHDVQVSTCCYTYLYICT